MSVRGETVGGSEGSERAALTWRFPQETIQSTNQCEPPLSLRIHLLHHSVILALCKFFSLSHFRITETQIQYSDKSLNIDLLKESAEEKKINMPKTDIDLKKKIDEEAKLSKIRNLSSKYEIRCDVVTKMKKYIKGILEISSQFLIFGEIDDNIV